MSEASILRQQLPALCFWPGTFAAVKIADALSFYDDVLTTLAGALGFGLAFRHVPKVWATRYGSMR